MKKIVSAQKLAPAASDFLVVLLLPRRFVLPPAAPLSIKAHSQPTREERDTLKGRRIASALRDSECDGANVTKSSRGHNGRARDSSIHSHLSRPPNVTSQNVHIKPFLRPMARSLSLFPSPHRQTPTDSHADTYTMVQALVNRKSNYTTSRQAL